jgi:hypothetical protein
MTTLNNVAREQLLAGGERNAIYIRFSLIPARAAPFARWHPSEPGRHYAFHLYFASTFDLI